MRSVYLPYLQFGLKAPQKQQQHTMSARTSSTAAVQSAASSSSTAYVPRAPPRRQRSSSVAGQQQQQRLDCRNGHAPRRSLAAVVSPFIALLLLFGKGILTATWIYCTLA